MFKDTNPQFTYYIMLYALTLILRAIRAYNARPTDPATKEAKTYWTQYLYFGFELVNVSAGVFILLTQSAAGYVGTIMMLYVILVVVSFFLESSNVGRTLKTAGHIGVSVVVFAVTLFAFIGYDGLNKSQQRAAAEADNNMRQWKVALPFMDTALNKFHGTRQDLIISSFEAQVNATSRHEAVAKAKAVFQSDQGPVPFQTKQPKTPITMVIVDDRIVAEALPAVPR